MNYFFRIHLCFGDENQENRDGFKVNTQFFLGVSTYAASFLQNYKIWPPITKTFPTSGLDSYSITKRFGKVPLSRQSKVNLTKRNLNFFSFIQNLTHKKSSLQFTFGMTIALGTKLDPKIDKISSCERELRGGFTLTATSPRQDADIS